MLCASLPSEGRNRSTVPKPQPTGKISPCKGQGEVWVHIGFYPIWPVPTEVLGDFAKT